MTDEKPIGRKNYGSIPHLPGSRTGPADKTCHEGQARIATVKRRDKHDLVIVTEKLDGSNVGVARIGDTIAPLGRAGYLAASSPHEQHRLFAAWAWENFDRFMAALEDGERIVGEWLAQAHGTRYDLPHEPFVMFDVMRGAERMPWDTVIWRARMGGFVTPTVLTPPLLWSGPSVSISIEMAMGILGTYGFHGALDPVEGAVWRVERDKVVDKTGRREHVVDFLVKYVRPDKVDGEYLPEKSGEKPIWNWRPE